MKWIQCGRADVTGSISSYDRPDGNMPGLGQDVIQASMPRPPIRPIELNIEDVISIGPRLMELKDVGPLGINVQHRTDKGFFLTHGVEHRVEEVVKAANPIRLDVEGDNVCLGVQYFASPADSRERVMAAPRSRPEMINRFVFNFII